MLLACTQCHRQYEVGAYPVGSLVRCLCGHRSEVPEPRVRKLEMLHCSNCGGRLQTGLTACEYCAAQIKLADRGLGPACPECFATTLDGARFCSSCGVCIGAEVVIRALSDRACPRCKQPLSECESKELRYVECQHCGGLWLDEALFERMAQDRDRRLAPAIRGTLPSPSSSVGMEQVRYLPCPVCGEIMNRRNFAACSGVILDWCRGHGWWFDASELERVLDFLQRGGMDRSRRMEHERRLDEVRRKRDRSQQSAIPTLVIREPSLLERLAATLLTNLPVAPRDPQRRPTLRDTEGPATRSATSSRP